ncbi:MAG: hypothetical protein FWC89_05500 [Defluviitaleaceae bacterium]|nr:hypothetical protein [Defluviitaleaceae bacterium]
MQKFVQWIKWKPKEELVALTPMTFAKDAKITIEASNNFFEGLCESNLAKPKPRIKCDNCGDIITFYGKDDDIYTCEICDGEISMDYQDLENIVYSIDKNDFRNASFSTQTEILKTFRTEKNAADKMECLTMPKNTDAIEVNPVKIAIITALEKELNPLHSLIVDCTSIGNGVYTYHEGFFINDDAKISVVAAHCHNMGMVATTGLTMDIIHKYKPEYVAMIGMAASLEGRNHHGYGDILVPSSILDYGSGKIVEDSKSGKSFLFEPYMLDLDAGLMNKLKNFKRAQDVHRDIKDLFGRVATTPNTELKLDIGVMASGSAVVASKGFSDEMITPQHRKIIGIDMEIYGMFHACRYNDTECKPKCFAMKSVVDYADNEKSDKFHDYACFVSANAIQRFALNHLCE